MANNIDILNEILDLVGEYVELQAEDDWSPGDFINYSGPYFDEKEYKEAIKSLLTGRLAHGDKCKQFEVEVGGLLGKKYAVFVNSGSSANFLMFNALSSRGNFGDKFKLPEGSKVLTPVTCFPTTVSPIIQCGFEPIFCDVTLPSLNPNLDEVEQLLDYYKKIDDPIKIFIYAHVMGNPVDLDRLQYLMDKYDCIFLEDACDAYGGSYDGRPLGSFGKMSTMSLYVAHGMTSIEGGVIATDDPQLLRLLDSQRSWGRGCHCSCPITNNNFDELKGETACGNRFSNWLVDSASEICYDHRYIFNEMSMNLKPIELQGAIALEQLKKMPEMIEARRKNFDRLYDVFCSKQEYFHLPEKIEKADPNWFGFLVTCKDSVKRQHLVDWLEDHNIQTRAYFTGNIMYHKGYNHLADKYRESLKDRFPNAHEATKNSFFLGTWIGLTKEKVDYIGECLEGYLRTQI